MRCAIALVVSALLPAMASAQDTRAAVVAAAQAEKAARLATYEPSKAERIAANVKRRLFDTPNGFYPWFDSVYSGGGFTLGAGYRQYYGDQTFWSARGLFSAKAYKLVEVGTTAPGLGRGAVNLDVVAGWRDATQVAFYGVGGETTPDAKSNFQMKQGYAGVFARARPPGPTFLDLGVRYEDFTLAPGHGNTPSIETIHTAETAPGFGDNPSYARMTFAGGVDWRPSAGYARRGGLYALTYDAFHDLDGVYTFDVLQGEIVQHVPIVRENWVFSMRGVAKTTLDDSDTVPYFLMPSLGSGSTLRAYPSWRFRDRHSLLLTGEWRWIPNRTFLDVAIFYDAGKVVSRREDLNFARLEHNWGLGFRLHGPLTTPLRIEVARGREGYNLVFSGGAAF